MEWFRFYTRTLDSRKVQELPSTLFKYWVNLLCLARVHDGPLPDFEEIGFRLRVAPSQAENIVTELVRRQLIDRKEDGSFFMHDWNEHQRVSDNVAERVRKHRAKQGGNVTVTPPERDRAEQSRDRAETDAGAVAPPTVRARADRFGEFVAPWPRVANPDHVARAWLSCIDTPADEALAFAARDRYLASDEVSRGVVTDPAKWLMDQKSAKWGGKWPTPKHNGTNGKPSTAERALQTMLTRASKGERPA